MIKGMVINKENFKLKIILIFLFLILTFFPLISASGVAVPYWDGNPLKLAPGESTIVSLILQNMIGNEDLSFEAAIIGGNEIATLTDNNNVYLVDFGNSNVPVNLKISVPESAAIGSKYDATVSFKQVASGEGGFLRLATGFTTKIPVQVVGEQESELYLPEEAGNKNIFIILAVAVLIIVAIVVVMRKKRMQ